MTSPYRRESIESVLGDQQQRISILEATVPQPIYAFYEIKLSPDTDTPDTPVAFMWAVPSDLDGWYLDDAQGFVTEQVSGDDVLWNVINVTTGNTMTQSPVVIDDGDYTSYTSAFPSVVDTAFAQVATGQILGIEYGDTGGVNGHGALLRFTRVAPV